MFIELTDHLRCPADHTESYLVLLPGEMRDRRVLSGSLGCPVCGRVVEIREGTVAFEPAPPAAGGTGLTADGAAVLLGLSGPGGYLALVGAVCGIAAELEPLLEGVGIVLVNPPAGAATVGSAGVLYAGRLPLKSSCLRGIVVSADFARPEWIRDAASAVLPGLRVLVEGGEPPEGLVEELARSPGGWLGKRKA